MRSFLITWVGSKFNDEYPSERQKRKHKHKGDDHVKTGIHKPRSAWSHPTLGEPGQSSPLEPSEGALLCDLLVSEFWPLELWENTLLILCLLWSFVTANMGKQYIWLVSVWTRTWIHFSDPTPWLFSSYPGLEFRLRNISSLSLSLSQPTGTTSVIRWSLSHL